MRAGGALAARNFIESSRATRVVLVLTQWVALISAQRHERPVEPTGARPVFSLIPSGNGHRAGYDRPSVRASCAAPRRNEKAAAAPEPPVSDLARHGVSSASYE